MNSRPLLRHSTTLDPYILTEKLTTDECKIYKSGISTLVDVNLIFKDNTITLFNNTNNPLL